MNPKDSAELHRRAKAIFFDLMDTPKESWEAAIHERCAADSALAKEVASLLANKEADTDCLMPMVSADCAPLPSEISAAMIAGLSDELATNSECLDPGLSQARRFIPGSLFADRYRMHSRLGAGGMGEVWRATDEMLGEAVALKFIRKRSAGHGWIQRLLQEAAVARRVSHKNVCRVHDAGEMDGEFFLSMQFVQGLDLAKELRKNGRFKRGPSKRLARELVDALVAVHACGLLHRDLKPANILLDSEHTAHVSDFGLAVTNDRHIEENSQSGTRVYMAPELQQGAAPSQASDVYALGLILYEAVTNRRAFQSGEEIRLAAENGELPPRPSVFVTRVNAVLEHIILRCLDPEPSARPSALDLQRALALEDPLEAVLSLGDVPTAEVIATSRSRVALSPNKAKWVALATLLLLGLAALLTRLGAVSTLPEASPGQRAKSTRMLLQEFGIPPAPFEKYSYSPTPEGLELAGQSQGTELSGTSGTLGFWYRSSPASISPTSAANQLFGFGRATLLDPPTASAGMSSIYFHPDGTLGYFRSVPQAEVAAQGALPSARFFELAGLEQADFDPVAPLQPTTGPARTHLAWQSRESGLRVELSGTGQRPFSFETRAPQLDEAASSLDWAKLAGLLNSILVLALFVIAVPKALRHFRSGRGDAWVSLRLAVICGGSLFAAWIANADYPDGSVKRLVFVMAGVFVCLSSSNLIWIFCVAVEPSLQSTWPRIFVTWSRLLRGQHGGRGVRSDLLVGICLGTFAVCLQALSSALSCEADWTASSTSLLRGANWLTWFSNLAETIPGSLLLNLEFVAVLATLGWILRSRRASVIGTGLVACVISAGSTESGLEAALAMLTVLLILYCLLRHGLLASFTLILCQELLVSTPMPHSGSAWYAGAFYGTLALILLALSWATRPLLRPQEVRREPLS